jgi:transcription elongation GreA/GreB family factor
MLKFHMESFDLKNKIIQEILTFLKLNLDNAHEAQNSIKEYSQSSELKQESKYDTRAIEASYLKDAQAKRVYELSESIDILKKLVLVTVDKVKVGSLVKIDVNGLECDYFLSPVISPKEVFIENQKIQIATLNSPLGQGLLNLEVGEDFELQIGVDEKVITLLKID